MARLRRALPGRLDVLPYVPYEDRLGQPVARALLRREWLNGLYTAETYFTAVMASNAVLAALNTLVRIRVKG